MTIGSLKRPFHYGIPPGRRFKEKPSKNRFSRKFPVLYRGIVERIPRSILCLAKQACLVYTSNRQLTKGIRTGRKKVNDEACCDERE